MPYKPTDRIKVFKEVPELGCFVVEKEFQRVSDALGLTEWHAAVWIGRLFVMDNDFGEHWFDNWDEREALSKRAEELGIVGPESFGHELLVVVPKRFQDGKDGPCHSDEFRKRFWDEVLSGLSLSYGLLCDEARQFNKGNKELDELTKAKDAPEYYIQDLEQRIESLAPPEKLIS